MPASAHLLNGKVSEAVAKPPAAAATIMPARAKSMRAVTHRLVLSWHRWTGLTVGLVLVFMAATGILLSYRSRMEPAVYRDLLTAPACDAAMEPPPGNGRATGQPP